MYIKVNEVFVNIDIKTNNPAVKTAGLKLLNATLIIEK